MSGRDFRLKRMKYFLTAIVASCALVVPTLGQQFAHDISLSGLGNGDAKPFGLAYEPTSNQLYVALSGSFGTPNNVVAVIDVATDTVKQVIPVGLYPEDIAFVYDASGNFRYGAVTNSTSGSVTLWDDQDQVVATVALPDPWMMGSCYPFGITASEDGQFFYITTQDGTGEIYAVNVNTLSLDTTAGLAAPFRSGGRPVHANGTLFAPMTTYTATWTGSEAGLGACSSVATNYTMLHVEDEISTYPSGQDLVQLPDGRMVWGGLFANNRLYIFSADGALEQTVSCSAGAHGLGVNETGDILVACGLYGNLLSFVDLNTMKEISTVSVSNVGLGYSMPNDAVFAGGKLYVTSHGTEEVMVFDNLPTAGQSNHTGSLVISNPSPSAGEFLDVSVNGEGITALVSADATWPTMTSYGFLMDIGPNLRIHGHGMNAFQKTFRVPLSGSVAGTHHWMQGAQLDAGVWTTTEPRVLVLQ